MSVVDRARSLGEQLLDNVQERVGVTAVALAAPPAGSGLKPVMGEKGLPLVGKSLEIMRNGFQTAARWYDAYGGVTWSRAFGRDVVWVMGPDAVQEVLTNRSKAFSQSGWVYFIGPFFTRGLMLLDGQEHLLHRRIMQEAFTRPRIAAYQGHVQLIIDDHLPTWQEGEPMLMFPAIKQTSLDIATQVFMGAERGEESERVIEAFEDTVRAGTGLIRTGLPVVPTRWNKGLSGRKVLETYFRELIPAKRASENDDDLFAALCHVETDDGFRFTDDDVVNHMIFLMMAAHDTSTITATAMVYYLAKHPDWQAKARAESVALGDAPLEVEALDSLETLGLVFNEAMRLVAPVPAMVRETTEDVDLDGHYVPTGTLVAVVPGAAHRLVDRWPQPDDFAPDRHAPPRDEQKAHRFGYVPFGGGAHKCIGMVFGSAEVKALVHKMLLRWEFVVPEDYELEWDFTSLVVPKDGFPVALRPL